MSDRPTLSLAEAVRRSDRSRSSIQRALKAGEVDGAHWEDPDDPPSGLIDELEEVEVTGPPAVDLARNYGAPPSGAGGDGQP